MTVDLSESEIRTASWGSLGHRSSWRPRVTVQWRNSRREVSMFANNSIFASISWALYSPSIILSNIIHASTALERGFKKKDHSSETPWDCKRLAVRKCSITFSMPNHASKCSSWYMNLLEQLQWAVPMRSSNEKLQWAAPMSSSTKQIDWEARPARCVPRSRIF